MQEFIRLNTAFILPSDIKDKVLEIIGKVDSSYKREFVVDGNKFIPHMTIYSPEYPKSNINKIIDRMNEIVEQVESPLFEFDKVFFDKGFLGLNFKLTNDIRFIHEQVVLGLNEFREGRIREKYLDPEVTKDYSDDEKEYINLYGYKNIFDKYIPHITLGKFDEKDMNIGEVNLPSFQPTRIGIFTMGDNGTCKELLEAIDLY